MQRTPTRRSAARRSQPQKSKPPARRFPPEWGDHSPTYEARLKAAGLDGNAPPAKDMDELRNRLARRIAIIINSWHGCPERLCQRQRGCMAPNIACTNYTPQPSTPEQTARVMADIQRALRAVVARRDEGEE